MKILKTLKGVLGFFVLMSMLLTAGCVMAETENRYSVEYYRSFAGYNLPLRLTHKITKEEAEAGASGAAYYIAYFDVDRRLARVVKMFHGTVIFEHKYSYYPSGSLMRVEGKNNEGIVKIEEYYESGKVKNTVK